MTRITVAVRTRPTASFAKDIIQIQPDNKVCLSRTRPALLSAHRCATRLRSARPSSSPSCTHKAHELLPNIWLCFAWPAIRNFAQCWDRRRHAHRRRTRACSAAAQGVVVELPKQHADEVVNNQNSSFSWSFDAILHNAPQETVYSRIAAPAVADALRGINATVLMYGQTGSGKTYTAIGDMGTFKYRGLVPRALADIFAYADHHPENEVSVAVSHLEIYNDQLTDLLAALPASALPAAPPQGSLSPVRGGGVAGGGAGASGGIGFGGDLQICESSKTGEVSVKGQRIVPVASEEAALALLFEGESNRAVARHELNKTSTRGHSVFTIHLAVRSRVESSGKVLSAKLNLVDLAGSERLKKTGTSGERMAESMSINRSLSYLEQLVVALASKNRSHLPYRQSKLTHLLKDAIGGNCRTSLIACIHGEAQHIEETVSTLQFASRAMRVTNAVNVNAVQDQSQLLRRYEGEIRQLRQELAMHDSLAGRSRVACAPRCSGARCAAAGAAANGAAFCCCLAALLRPRLLLLSLLPLLAPQPQFQPLLSPLLQPQPVLPRSSLRRVSPTPLPAPAHTTAGARSYDPYTEAQQAELRERLRAHLEGTSTAAGPLQPDSVRMMAELLEQMKARAAPSRSRARASRWRCAHAVVMSLSCAARHRSVGYLPFRPRRVCVAHSRARYPPTPPLHTCSQVLWAGLKHELQQRPQPIDASAANGGVGSLDAAFAAAGGGAGATGAFSQPAAGDESAVGELDLRKSAGIAVGLAPDNAAPAGGFEMPTRRSPGGATARSPGASFAGSAGYGGGFGSPGDGFGGDASGGYGETGAGFHGNASRISAMSASGGMGMDRNEAFAFYKTQGGGAEAAAELIAAKEAQQRTRLAMRASAERVNGLKVQIARADGLLAAKRAERARIEARVALASTGSAARNGTGHGGDGDGEELIIDEEEYALLKSLKGLKADYRAAHDAHAQCAAEHKDAAQVRACLTAASLACVLVCRPGQTVSQRSVSATRHVRLPSPLLCSAANAPHPNPRLPVFPPLNTRTRPPPPTRHSMPTRCAPPCLRTSTIGLRAAVGRHLMSSSGRPRSARPARYAQPPLLAADACCCAAHAC